MLSLRLLSRGNLPQYATTVQRLHTTTLLLESSDSSSSSDSNKKSSKKKMASKAVQSPEEKLNNQRETTKRLNSLLDKMIKGPKIPKKMDLSMPPKKPSPAIVQPQRYEEKLINAANEVATSLGGDVQKTKSDLLKKLLSSEKAKSDDDSMKNKTSAPLNLGEFVSGMKIDRTRNQDTEPWHQSKKSAISEILQTRSKNFRRKHRNDLPEHKEFYLEPGNLYGNAPLEIFDTSQESSESPDVPKLKTWEYLEANDFRLAKIHPPENIFQEMITWTKQGKLWKFPIDNEQGLEEEQSVHFSEHVFLERHLQDWCPKRGPIRHFMELVCVGLSKNPYMTVKEKKDHINWYREFFGSKEQLLKEIGAVEGNIKQESKQIEA